MTQWRMVLLTGLFLGIFAGTVLAAPNVHISSVSGEVAVEQDGVTAQALVGVPLQDEGKIRTEAGGQVDVTLNGVAGFRLLGYSRYQGECHCKSEGAAGGQFLCDGNADRYCCRARHSVLGTGRERCW